MENIARDAERSAVLSGVRPGCQWLAAGRSPAERHRYHFALDPVHRLVDVAGYLVSGPPAPRSRWAQAQAGGTDRRRGDDGGHFIARRFNGPSDPVNHFAQSARFNRGAYRALEDSWARALRQGKSVFVRIRPSYPGHSQRPSVLVVSWTVDGERQERLFPN